MSANLLNAARAAVLDAAMRAGKREKNGAFAKISPPLTSIPVLKLPAELHLMIGTYLQQSDFHSLRVPNKAIAHFLNIDFYKHATLHVVIDESRLFDFETIASSATATENISSMKVSNRIMGPSYTLMTIDRFGGRSAVTHHSHRDDPANDPDCLIRNMAPSAEVVEKFISVTQKFKNVRKFDATAMAIDVSDMPSHKEKVNLVAFEKRLAHLVKEGALQALESLELGESLCENANIIHVILLLRLLSPTLRSLKLASIDTLEDIEMRTFLAVLVSMPGLESLRASTEGFCGSTKSRGDTRQKLYPCMRHFRQWDQWRFREVDFDANPESVDEEWAPPDMVLQDDKTNELIAELIEKLDKEIMEIQ